MLRSFSCSSDSGSMRGACKLSTAITAHKHQCTSRLRAKTFCASCGHVPDDSAPLRVCQTPCLCKQRIMTCLSAFTMKPQPDMCCKQTR
jgi:hypothetical protein